MIVKDFEGRDWEFDIDSVTVDQWRELKRKYKMTPKACNDGLEEVDPDALTFAYWVMLDQNGRAGQPLGDNLKFDLIKFNNALGTATEEAGKQAKAAKQAELEEAAAAAVPTASRPAGLPSPEPPSLPDTTPLPPGETPDPQPGTGSGAETSNGSALSTSSLSPGSALSALTNSGG